jgi:tRNA-2-methylthio-N6-dimethylallyladenosine synthase
MADRLPEELIEERHRQTLDVINGIAAQKHEACVGRTFQVLVEGPSRRNAARLEGRTRSNKIVIFEGDPRLRGQLVDVHIERAGSFTLYGVPVGLESEPPVTKAVETTEVGAGLPG